MSLTKVHNSMNGSAFTSAADVPANLAIGVYITVAGIEKLVVTANETETVNGNKLRNVSARAAFPTNADLISSGDISVAEIVRTEGASAVGDGRGRVYKIYAASTYTAGPTVIDLTGISGQAVSLTTKFDTVAELLLDTRPDALFVADEYFEAQGFRYQKALAAATDSHAVTVGGVKLYRTNPGVLGDGTINHTDGTNTLTGSSRIFLGNLTPSNDDSALMIGRDLTGSYVSGAHAVRDETEYLASGTGLFAYASYDSTPKFTGTVNYNHLHSFQSRPNFSGTGTIDEIAGVTYQATVASGTVTDMYGVRMMDTLGAGAVTNFYAYFVDPTIIHAATSYAFYSASTALVSYHGGRFKFGTAPSITAAGFTTYGAILGHDTTGNLLSNPTLTIVNGVLQFSTSTAHIKSTAAQLQLTSSTGIVQINGGAQLPVYTVATLPAAAGHDYVRCFVSDATANTYGATVAGGGAVKAPVWSDGTNWIIG